jgi:hypothetical protein
MLEATLYRNLAPEAAGADHGLNWNLEIYL